MMLFKTTLRKNIEAQIAKYEKQIASLETEKKGIVRSLFPKEYIHLLIEIEKLRDKSQLLKSLL